MMQSVLSIQSSVTIGAVGNTMADIVMSAQRLHLCRVDTVQLAAHPGYGFRAGGSIDDRNFMDILDGIDRLSPSFSAIMTGYIGQPGQIGAISTFLKRQSNQHPDVPVIVDPAIGDHGKLYVDPDIANEIKVSLIALADVITPNSFELGWLTDSSINTRTDAADAAQMLLHTNSKLSAVVLTGLKQETQISDALFTRQGQIFFDKDGAGTGFPGGGDMFAAILVAAMVTGKSLQEATERASLLCHAILEESRKKGSAEIMISAIQHHLS